MYKVSSRSKKLIYDIFKIVFYVKKKIFCVCYIIVLIIFICEIVDEISVVKKYNFIYIKSCKLSKKIFVYDLC